MDDSYALVSSLELPPLEDGSLSMSKFLEGEAAGDRVLSRFS